MILARVVGNVVSTAKHAAYGGQKILVVAPEEPGGAAAGEDLLAVDGVGAGVGERVLVVLEGRAAGVVMGAKRAPADAAVVAIVDRVDLLG